MWFLFFVMAALSAGIVGKLAKPLVGKGLYGHSESVTAQDCKLALAVIIALPVAGLMLYLWLGNPQLRGSPIYLKSYATLGEEHFAMLAKRPTELLLESNAENLDALVNLAQINQRLGKNEAAEEFFKRSLEIAIKTNDWRTRPIATALGETQMALSNDIVTEDARKTFTFILSLHPENPVARYYMGMAMAQDGQKQEALAVWLRLLNEGPPGAYWKVRLRQQIALLRQDIGDDR